MSTLLVDGRPAEGVPADDRGLLFGDGLFETVAFHHGRAPLWPLHMARLERGCRALGIPAPAPQLLAEEADRVLAGRDREVVRITLTRGSGGRAYFPPESPRPRRILMRRDFPSGLEAQWADGISAASASMAIDQPDRLAGLKHLNRLPQVLLADFCARRGVEEALLFDPRGRLVEALAGNVVIAAGDRLRVPETHRAAVAGVGLEWLWREAGARLLASPLTREDLSAEHEIWVINSVSGIRPVRRLDGREHPIGEICRSWQARWQSMTETNA